MCTCNRQRFRFFFLRERESAIFRVCKELPFPVLFSDDLFQSGFFCNRFLCFSECHFRICKRLPVTGFIPQNLIGNHSGQDGILRETARVSARRHKNLEDAIVSPLPLFGYIFRTFSSTEFSAFLAYSKLHADNGALNTDSGQREQTTQGQWLTQSRPTAPWYVVVLLRLLSRCVLPRTCDTRVGGPCQSACGSIGFQQESLIIVVA